MDNLTEDMTTSRQATNILPGSQQPLSLMTINANPNRKEDLLIIRILEASERKMQLIKKLLSPEEFNSLHFDQYQNDFNISNIGDKRTQAINRTTDQTSYSVPTVVNSIEQQNIIENNNNNNKTKSWTGVLDSGIPKTSNDSQSNLAKKREALDFFFREAEQNFVAHDRQEDNLAIELRSGYYLGSQEAQINEDKLIKNQPFSLMDRLIGLLGFLGISYQRTFATAEQENPNDSLTGIRTNIGEPYTRKRNIVVMRQRLQAAGGELNKILGQVDGRQFCVQGKFSNRIDLAIMHKNHIVSTNNKTFSNDEQTFKVVQPVGHFNTIHLFSPQKFSVPSLQAKLILQEPSPFKNIFPSNTTSRQNLAKLSETTNVLRGVNLSAMELNFTKLLITNHRLMLAEERAALRIIELASRESSLVIRKGELLTGLARYIDMYSNQSNMIERLRKVCDTLIEIMKQIVLSQQEILVVANEMESFRSEQKFNSTSITVKANNSNLTSVDTMKNLMTKLINSIQFKGQDDEKSKEFISYCTRFLEQFLNYNSKEQIININLSGLKLTQNNECSTIEIERRRQIQYWLSSMRLRLILGDRYFYDCHLGHFNEFSNLLYQIDLKQNLTIPTFEGLRNTKSLELRVELFRPKYRFSGSLFMQLEASATIQLPLRMHQSNCISLQFLDDTNSAQLKFESKPEKRNSKKNCDKSMRGQRCKSNELLDLLYRKVFILTRKNLLDDSETKFSRLINKCDTRILVQLLGHKVKPKQKFHLDPFIDFLDDQDKLHTQPSHSDFRQYKSTRQTLLVWRWLNSLQQLVYLSERENAKNFSLQLEEFKSKLEAIVVKKQETGFRLIEQLRALAVDYIKEYEAQLKQVLKFRAEEEGYHERQQQQAIKLKDMLREPELKTVDLSGFVRVARSLVPKRTANRPLLPRRQASGNWSRLLKATQMLPESPMSTGPSGVDPEAQHQNGLSGHWQRLLSSHGASRLQLVVTIQQATNVPMRIVQARPMQSTTRPNSPFSPSIGSPTTSFMASMMQPMAPPMQYLIPPTTYVEIVFQRRQQASSLAQGKCPAWNETLFFPVDVATSSLQSSLQFATSGGQRGTNNNQLVDEFLQLNLYDYYCYLQDGPEQPETHNSSPSTMALVSSANEPQISIEPARDNNDPSIILGAQRIQAARQRVERHLLGSMRVPLTTLMSNGRIEGSFALKQPLILENYQFEPEMTSSSFGHNIGSIMRPNSPIVVQDWPTTKRSPETHISLFITLDPPISMPIHLLHLPTGSHESEQILELARLWELVVVHHRHRATNLSGQQTGSRPFARTTRNGPQRHRQSRHIRALVLQRDAKYCLISRLLVALEPPAELLADIRESNADTRVTDAMHSLARFVSLLSPLKYGLFGMRLLASSLWFDSSQLIDNCLGGPEEKAVLLCNYFLYLGISSALLLGEAVPEGRCVYVIVWHEQSRFIEDQLQLQAASLLESINSLVAGAPTAPTADPPNRMQPELYNQRPIKCSDFISRLPILMKANSVQLFDPNSGKSYTLANLLPLISVGSIVTMENIYANIQSAENPHDTNYDIRSKHLWFPLFDSSSLSSSSSSSTTAGVSLSSTFARSFGGGGGGQRKQNPQLSWRRQLLQLEAMRKSIGHPMIGPVLSSNTRLNYQKLSPEECDELKEAIVRVVKSHLLKWRPDRPTYFNRTLSRLVGEKLALFEGYLRNAQAAATDHNERDWRNELANLIKSEITMAHLSSSGLNTKQVISCPINLPYTSMKTIVDSIFASGVHNADLMLESSQLNQSNSGSSQFLVACHVHPYPARVMSVWLYVAAIIPNTKSFSNPGGWPPGVIN